jgi:hypothetical protein
MSENISLADSKAKIEVKVVSARDLPLPAYLNLQRSAFAEIFDKQGVEDFLDSQHFQWKYHPPAGEAKIAMILEEGQPVAANAMFPLFFRDAAGTSIVWQSCDTATLPKARGKGFFKKCLDALKQNLNKDDLFFGYPNANSVGGFKKFGWQEQTIVTTWVRPFPFLSFGSSNCSEIEYFSGEFDQLFERSFNGVKPSLLKDSSYLNWRYIKRPVKWYHCFEYRAKGTLAGAIVLRLTEVSGQKVVLVMDLIALDIVVERKLLQFAVIWSKQNGGGTMATILLKTSLKLSTVLSTGFLPVPWWLLPKRNILMGGSSEAILGKFKKNVWNSVTGDWDGF